MKLPRNPSVLIVDDDPAIRLLHRVATERSSGESKGFGFMEFNSDEEANAAIAGLNGREVNGQALKVNESKPRKDAGFTR